MIAKEISFLESNCIYMSKIFFLLLVENADKISHIVIIIDNIPFLIKIFEESIRVTIS